MSPGQCKWGDRSFMNMLEQGPLFLASLWCHALFVSPLTATQLGGVYLALRSLYPGIWLTKGGEAGPPFPFMFNFVSFLHSFISRSSDEDKSMGAYSSNQPPTTSGLTSVIMHSNL